MIDIYSIDTNFFLKSLLLKLLVNLFTVMTRTPAENDYVSLHPGLLLYAFSSFVKMKIVTYTSTYFDLTNQSSLQEIGTNSRGTM